MNDDLKKRMMEKMELTDEGDGKAGLPRAREVASEAADPKDKKVVKSLGDIPDDLLSGVLDDKGSRPSEKPSPKALEAPTEKHEEPKGLSAEARAAFKALRERGDKYEKELAELRPKLEASAKIAPEEVESLRKELLATKKKLGAYSLLEDPDFIERHKPVLEGVQKKISRLGEQFGVDAEVLKAGYSMSLKQLRDHLKEKAEDASDMLLPLYAEHQEAALRMRQEIEESEETQKALRQSAEERERKSLEGGFDALVQDLSQSHPLLKRHSTNEDWNKTLTTRLDYARQLFLDRTPKGRMQAAILASTADDYRDAFIRERAARLAAEKKLASAVSGSPRAGGDASAPGRESGDRPKNARDVARLILDKDE